MCLHLQKMRVSLLQELHLEFNRRTVIHLPGIPLRFSLEVRLLKESLLLQVLRTDDIDLSRKRGKTLIRRIAESGRSQRQDLPQMLAGLFQKIDKVSRTLSQVTDSMRGRERSRMYENTAHPVSPGSGGKRLLQFFLVLIHVLFFLLKNVF